MLYVRVLVAGSFSAITRHEFSCHYAIVTRHSHCHVQTEGGLKMDDPDRPEWPPREDRIATGQ